MKNWKRFIGEIEGHAQVFVVGPLFKSGIYKPLGPTVYVDGGNQFRPIAGDDGNIPSVTVGDGDSSDGDMDVVLPKDKNYSDLAFVLQTMPAHVRHIELLGFTGGRRDHELINYGETHKFLATKKQFTTVRFDDSIVAFVGGSLKMTIDGIFSVITMEEAILTITGACRYTLTRPTKISPASSFGLSNIGNGSVVIDCDKPCFLFLN